MALIKNNKGITLLELSIYIIVLMVIVGLLATTNKFFNKNLGAVQNVARYAASFDKFNSLFVSDVKDNKEAVVVGNRITFEDGTTYTYNQNDKGVYRGKIKIASNVVAFSATSKKIIINNCTKQIININIIIGESLETAFEQNIDYTLKYW